MPKCDVAVRVRPTCLECGKRLRPYKVGGHGRWTFGGYGDDLFCGLNCGYRWALMMANREIKASPDWLKIYRKALAEAHAKIAHKTTFATGNP